MQFSFKKTMFKSDGGKTFKGEKMKKISLIVCLLALLCTMGFSYSWSFQEMPLIAQEFVAEKFPNTSVYSVSFDYGKYNVILSNGAKIEFDGAGNWLEVKDAVVFPRDLIPAVAMRYLDTNFPAMNIDKIKHVNGKYEVKFKNGWQVVFNDLGDYSNYEWVGNHSSYGD